MSETDDNLRIGRGAWRDVPAHNLIDAAHDQLLGPIDIDNEPMPVNCDVCHEPATETVDVLTLCRRCAVLPAANLLRRYREMRAEFE